MARPILMPQVGQDLIEGKIVAIRLKVGDTVKKGDIVADVESEKATFEVEAFESGIILEIRHKAGDIATVLQPLMMVGEAGEVIANDKSTAAIGSSVPAAVEALKPLAMATAPSNQGQARSSPLARRLASETGLDIRQVLGSGPNGAVVKKDVEDLARGVAARPARPLFSPVGTASVNQAPGLRTLQSGQGDPVLFIHGFGTDLSSWRPFILHLGLANPILALDMPSHGANSNVIVPDFDALVSAVRAIIVAAGLNRLHLVGHSLGAGVAAHLAGGGGLDVRSLALISPAGLGPGINGDYIAGFLAANSEAALKPWLELLVHHPRMLPGALVRATLAGRSDAALFTNQRQLAAGVFSGNTQLFSIRDALGRFGGPVRMIVGSEDRIIPPSHSASVPAHVAVNRIAQVGHLPQLEEARLVARLVAETVRSGG